MAVASVTFSDFMEERIKSQDSDRDESPLFSPPAIPANAPRKPQTTSGYSFRRHNAKAIGAARLR
jgi:hypothetical protein